ncbi:MAG: hypothetical protein GY913_04515 [Proteobacteria bacterium]|nr:hypothetical protein [Pseudomonadota bacterium]MCP4916165.1 hypothetical protein [Pseudomonadota bacterium]
MTALLLALACTDPDGSDAPTYGDAHLTASEWADPDVSCETDADCLSGET